MLVPARNEAGGTHDHGRQMEQHVGNPDVCFAQTAVERQHRALFMQREPECRLLVCTQRPEVRTRGSDRVATGARGG